MADSNQSLSHDSGQSKPGAGPEPQPIAAEHRWHPLHALHERQFENFRFVYPVLSRRSRGISVGVNLNPDKVCNFDCIYCQVDRRTESDTQFVETAALLAELEAVLESALSGKIYEQQRFAATPENLRRVNDIAFSGDGEPTTHRNFAEVIAACAEVKRRVESKHAAEPVKMVLITNASMFHRPHVQAGLVLLDANHGEIWAKLDAGTEAYYQRIERTKIPFHQVLQNITAAAQARPIAIQSLFMRVQGEPPSNAELEAYCDRLNEIVATGGQIKLVQVYTVARQPAESFVEPLANAQVDAIAQLVEDRCGLPVAAFHGPGKG